ncbi:MAG: glutamate racemase [Deltaproteobacteria bacterium]|nr:glutamate racemase [Deltaproteobacteria bacterium]
MKTDLHLQPIGIFDSGIGGVSVLGQAVSMMLNESFVYYGGSGVEPYALLSPSRGEARCLAACDFLMAKGVKAIVVACNTATAVAIDKLRKSYPVPILGMEPAIKVAVGFNLPGKIVLMATGMTLKSKAVARLIDTYGNGFEIVKLGCRDLITLVESGVIEGDPIERAIAVCFSRIDPAAVSTIVLGCTHFGFLAPSIKIVLGDHIRIADGIVGTVRHLRIILEQRGLISNRVDADPQIAIHNSGGVGYAEKSKIILSAHLAHLKSKI